MNSTTPPPLPGVPSQPKTSALAIWSLVLGMVGMVGLGCLTGIPGVICGHLALSNIKQSGGRLAGQGLAIAGLVTGYIGTTIFMIGLMAAIAIPNFIKARETSMRNACINNLRQIDLAKHEWAADHNKKDTDTPVESDLLPYFHSHQFPQCPAGGEYIIGAVNITPACSITNHVMPVQ